MHIVGCCLSVHLSVLFELLTREQKDIESVRLVQRLHAVILLSCLFDVNVTSPHTHLAQYIP